MLPDLKTLLAVNPHAGKGQRRKICPVVREFPARMPLKLKVLPGELTDMA